MLPEKKKRLIIGIIATFAIIIIVILLALLSNYIKSRHENQNHERRNDAYPEKYEYFGITMDKDGIYKLYGISGDEEEYLNVRTFYNVEDMIIKNNKLVIYSDAVNELRYDKKTKEFYFYEIDSNYSNKYKVLLSKDYIVTKEDKIINYRKYNSEEIKNITNEAIDYEFLLYSNKVYYVSEDGIYEFNLNNEKTNKITDKTLEDQVKLISVNNKYVYTIINDEYIVYKIDSAEKINVSEYIKEPFTYVDEKDEALIFKDSEGIKTFSLITRRVSSKIYNTNGYEVEKSININDNYYYMNLVLGDNKKYVIIDLEEVNENNGKCFLAIEDEKVVGLIMGAVRKYDEYDYLDYKCPKCGVVTELVVSKNIRGKGIGKKLMQVMEEYFKSIGCEYISIEVFAYNKNAIRFYESEGYHTRGLIDIKKI